MIYETNAQTVYQALMRYRARMERFQEYPLMWFRDIDNAEDYRKCQAVEAFMTKRTQTLLNAERNN